MLRRHNSRLVKLSHDGINPVYLKQGDQFFLANSHAESEEGYGIHNIFHTALVEFVSLSEDPTKLNIKVVKPVKGNVREWWMFTKGLEQTVPLSRCFTKTPKGHVKYFVAFTPKQIEEKFDS